MARGGLLAILGKGPPTDDDEDSDGEPKTAKARALKAMFAAAKREDWDEAAHQFKVAYDECRMAKEDDEDDDSPLFQDEDEDEEY